ncbi:unnamed protein product [Lymnaea stagnalis]|uniref:Histone-lysine N-methyltransferase n=1 Tax=Lymnaea stagnalis TaxID=6523 RepID=A0AAV2IDJ0_LYMST
MGLTDFQIICETLNLKISLETKKAIFYDFLESLGPVQCHKLLSKFVADGLVTCEEEFEVETVLDHYKEDGQDYYLIKWLGWGHKHNSWEPASHLRCGTLLEAYHKELSNRKPRECKRKLLSSSESEHENVKKKHSDLVLKKISESRIIENMSLRDIATYYSHVKKVPPKKASRPRQLKSSKKHMCTEVKKVLKDWEIEMNAIAQGYDQAYLFVENNVDLEGPPSDFIYINERKEGAGVTISQDPLLGCDCQDCYNDRKTCCPTVSSSTLAYRKATGRLRVPRGVPIYECNKLCRCGPDCFNRVVQKGRKFKICIFRTANGRGWGVKSLQKIKKGSFVVEYVGEVITEEEAERRGQNYDVVGCTYLFDLDFHDADAPFSVDAGRYGNAAHFINHSCDPNLEVHVVWINTIDPRLPHICLFAKRDIQVNEELSFDYMSGNIMPENNQSFIGESLDTDPGATPRLDKQTSSHVTSDGNESLPSPNKHEHKTTDIAALDHNSGQSGISSPTKCQPNIDILTENHLSPEKVADTSDDFQNNTAGIPTPPSSESESTTGSPKRVSRFTMACLCGATNCRKYLFF